MEKIQTIYIFDTQSLKTIASNRQNIDKIIIKDKAVFKFQPKENLFVPISGRELGKSIKIREYFMPDFYEFAKNEGCIEVVLIPNTFIESSKYTIAHRYNFSKMINVLEKEGIVKCKPSEMWLTTDGRVFSLDDSTFFEVDCLGNSLCWGLTNKIIRIYEEKYLNCG